MENRRQTGNENISYPRGRWHSLWLHGHNQTLDTLQERGLGLSGEIENLLIGEPLHRIPAPNERPVSAAILVFAGLVVTTIDFDNQPMMGYEEIDDDVLSMFWMLDIEAPF